MTHLDRLQHATRRIKALVDQPSSVRPMPISVSVHQGAIHKLTILAAVLAAAILVAACGGSQATHTRKSADASSAIKFARCMRANGVPSFPDSGAEIQSSRDGRAVSINGVSVSSPAFQSAQQKCEHYISSGAPISAAERAKFRQEILKVARCMRAHGVPDYPDSGTWTGPNPNPQSPAFQAAAKKCHTGVATSMSLP